MIFNVVVIFHITFIVCKLCTRIQAPASEGADNVPESLSAQRLDAQRNTYSCARQNVLFKPPRSKAYYF